MPDTFVFNSEYLNRLALKIKKFKTQNLDMKS